MKKLLTLALLFQIVSVLATAQVVDFNFPSSNISQDHLRDCQDCYKTLNGVHYAIVENNGLQIATYDMATSSADLHAINTNFADASGVPLTEFFEDAYFSDSKIYLVYKLSYFTNPSLYMNYCERIGVVAIDLNTFAHVFSKTIYRRVYIDNPRVVYDANLDELYISYQNHAPTSWQTTPPSTIADDIFLNSAIGILKLDGSTGNFKGTTNDQAYYSTETYSPGHLYTQADHTLEFRNRFLAFDQGFVYLFFHRGANQEIFCLKAERSSLDVVTHSALNLGTIPSAGFNQCAGFKKVNSSLVAIFHGWAAGAGILEYNANSLAITNCREIRPPSTSPYWEIYPNDIDYDPVKGQYVLAGNFISGRHGGIVTIDNPSSLTAEVYTYDQHYLQEGFQTDLNGHYLLSNTTQGQINLTQLDQPCLTRNTYQARVVNHNYVLVNTFTMNQVKYYGNTLQNSPNTAPLRIGTAASYCRGTGYSAYKKATSLSPVPYDDAHLIYPNPATNSINIPIDENKIITGIDLRNIQGQLMQAYPVGTNSKNLVIDVSSWPKGIYLVEHKNGLRTTSTQKVILK